MNRLAALMTLAAALACAAPVPAADWPTWRADAQRSAASPEALPDALHLEWMRQYPARVPAWKDTLNRDLMPYDRVFEPIVAQGRLFLGFNDTDKVVALDAATGEELWRFYTDGPIRFAPSVHEGRVYVVSDDGALYCLDAGTGNLAWRFNAAPLERRILGNERLISTWPVRGAPVIADGTVYFAAGIWPFMGTFIYALDAETGAVQWLNDSDGPTYQEQPHGGAFAFGGVGPQGYFTIAGGVLLIPGGRSVPAAFDRATGAFMHYEFNANNKTGGSFVCTDGETFFNHHRDRVVNLYDVATGKELAGHLGEYPVMTRDAYYMVGDSVRALDAAQVRDKPAAWRNALLWELPVDASGGLVKAGDKLYAGGDGVITAIQLHNGAPAEVAWTMVVNGRVERLVPANGRLYAVTLDGKILAYGPKAGEPRTVLAEPVMTAPSPATPQARELLAKTGVREGYALFYGPGDGHLLEALAVESRLHIIAFEPDPGRLAALRRRFDDQGLYGRRIALIQGGLDTARVAPYLASLTVVHDTAAPPSAAAIERIYHAMRPYGGVACFTHETAGALAALVTQAGLHGLEMLGDGPMMARQGPLEGAAPWVGLLGDAAQSGKSDDMRVKLPLGLLWFGGSTHENVLPRHGHGPSEQVIGGRLFIQGPESMEARDVYTGRVLWHTPLLDLDTFNVYYDESFKDAPLNTRYNQEHIPGANIRNTNFFACDDLVYVLQKQDCTVLDAVTGRVVNTLRLPPENPDDRKAEPPYWGYIGISGGLLVGGAGFVPYSDLVPMTRSEYNINEDFDRSASRRLVAMDRHTGAVKWQIQAKHGFPHNATIMGGGMLFCLDRVPEFIEDRMKRRGKTKPGDYALAAYDLETGEQVWQVTDGFIGSFLCYDDERDILLQAMRPSRDTVPGEVGRYASAFRGKTGERLWEDRVSYVTFPLLYHGWGVSESGAFDLETGERVEIACPLTGEETSWRWKRTYGCNHPLAAECMLTFRSGAAGFYDIANMGGTGNFGGFKSGCTANLVAADGVLNAPDYTRTCSCSYPNQTSLALVHWPLAEIWTFNDIQPGGGAIERLGLNFGAPGDRRTADGTLWLDYPVVGGPSPEIPITVSGNPKWFLHSSLRYAGDGPRWVAASGGEGLEKLKIALIEEGPPRNYTVRLHFAEPADIEPGARVFAVQLQGETAIDALDVVKEAGGPRTTLVREAAGVRVRDALEIVLTPASGSAHPPLLCGIEIVAE